MQYKLTFIVIVLVASFSGFLIAILSNNITQDIGNNEIKHTENIKKEKDKNKVIEDNDFINDDEKEEENDEDENDDKNIKDKEEDKKK